MMRVDDKSKFEYLLNRGILPSATDNEGYNAIHFAIRMEKIDFLSYLLEGDYSAHEN
jgi:ankyrin repeat protein